MAISNALNINFTANQLLYASSGTVLAGLTTANNGVLITSAGGVPSVSSTLPNAVQDNITRLGTIASIGAPLGGSFGGTGVNNGASVIALGGNISTAGSLTLSGAFATTFTFTGATSVTFPTSGTLATTAAIPSFPLSLANGGTNANLTASNGGIFYSTATAGAILSGTATARQMLQSGATAAPAWSTSVWPATTTINEILYSSAGNTVTGLTTGNDGVLITSAGGVPSISSTLPSAVQGNITSVGTISSGNWNGSVIAGQYGGTGVANTGKTITVGGNTTFSGAFTFTGTVTGNTSVTFPTSGTLSTTTGTVTSVATAGLATGGAITSTGTVTVTAAVKSDQTTGTSTAVAVVPGVQQFHASATKGWVKYTSSTGAILASYNVSSVTNNGSGDNTVNWTTAFTSSDYEVNANVVNDTNGAATGVWFAQPIITSLGSNAQRIQTSNGLFALSDPTAVYVSARGTQ